LEQPLRIIIPVYKEGANIEATLLGQRIPDVRKAKELMAFEATVSLRDVWNEIIPGLNKQIEIGRI